MGPKLGEAGVFSEKYEDSANVLPAPTGGSGGLGSLTEFPHVICLWSPTERLEALGWA
jgi:hypothetical protein